MLFLKMVFWLLAVFMVFCFMCCIANASTGTSPKAKLIDAVVGVIIAGLIVFMIKYFGGACCDRIKT